MRCGVPSYRAEGCAVMWCSRCHAFWHWETGRAIEGRAPPHNPDHRAWAAAGGAAPAREVGDVPCGGLPDGATLHEGLMREFARTLTVHPMTPLIVDAVEGLHAAQRLRHRYPCAWDEETVHEPLRVAHLNGELDEAAFGVALERHERALLFRRDVGRVLECLVLCGADVVQRFCAVDGAAVTAGRLVELRALVAAALERVGEVHRRAVPRLRHNWEWELPHGRLRV